MKQEQLDPLVKKIAKSKTRTMIDGSLREIQADVTAETGYTPSTSILSAALHRIGAISNGKRWLWKHRVDHE